MNDQPKGQYGIVIFDGYCGACSTFIGRKKKFFEKHGFTVAPLQEAWVQELTGLDESTLTQAIHLRTTQGEILRGIDFFQYFAGKVWWLSPVSFLLRIKVLRPLLTTF